MSAAERIENEMVEKIRERVDPAIPDPWSKLKIYLRPHASRIILKDSDDFVDLFEELKRLNIVILGCYDALNKILDSCDAPAARIARGYEKQIEEALTDAEKTSVEDWQREKALRVTAQQSEKSTSELEADMIVELRGEISPSDTRDWKTFKLRLGLKIADIEECQNFESVFALLKRKGKISPENFDFLIEVFDKFNVPARDIVKKHQRLIQERSSSNTELGLDFPDVPTGDPMETDGSAKEQDKLAIAETIDGPKIVQL